MAIGNVIYLDNAATSWPKPPGVAQAMARFLAEDSANPGRAGHRMAVATERIIDAVRRRVTAFIGGTDPQRMIFTLNGTDALNIAIKGLLRPGDHVITTMLEHNSVSRPLQALADAGFIELTRVGFSPATGVVDPDDIRRAIGPKTRLVVMTHASNVLGTVQPIDEVGRMARDHGVRFLVDAAQSIGTIPIDVQRDCIDALAFPGHKSLHGPTGTGGLYVSPTIPTEAFTPLREGGTGGDSSSATQPREWPYLLEGGTPNTVGLAGLGAAIDFVLEREPTATLAHEQSLIRQLWDALAANPRIRLYGPPPPPPPPTPPSHARVGVLSFTIEDLDPVDVAGILDQSFAIAVRPGLHCAPYTHRTLGTFPHGTVRVSPGPFTTPADIDALVRALAEIPA